MVVCVSTIGAYVSRKMFWEYIVRHLTTFHYMVLTSIVDRDTGELFGVNSSQNTNWIYIRTITVVLPVDAGPVVYYIARRTTICIWHADFNTPYMHLQPTDMSRYARVYVYDSYGTYWMIISKETLICNTYKTSKKGSRLRLCKMRELKYYVEI